MINIARIVLNKTWECDNDNILGLSRRKFMELMFEDVERAVFLDEFKMSLVDFMILQDMSYRKLINARCIYRYLDNAKLVLYPEQEYLIIFNENCYLMLAFNEFTKAIGNKEADIVVNDKCHIQVESNIVNFIYNGYSIEFTYKDYVNIAQRIFEF